MKHRIFNMGVIAFVGAASVLCLAPAEAQAGCTLYEHRDFGGASWYLNDHETMLMVDGVDLGCTTNGHGGACMSYIYEASWNDALSSFTVDPGCTITLWEHINQGGAYFITYRSYSYVGSGWNDVTSEASCVCS